jgi:hypothetical protein
MIELLRFKKMRIAGKLDDLGEQLCHELEQSLYIIISSQEKSTEYWAAKGRERFTRSLRQQ